jgi:hypothetical protein
MSSRNCSSRVGKIELLVKVYAPVAFIAHAFPDLFAGFGHLAHTLVNIEDVAAETDASINAEGTVSGRNRGRGALLQTHGGDTARVRWRTGSRTRGPTRSSGGPAAGAA